MRNPFLFFIFTFFLYSGIYFLSRLNQQRFRPELLETMITQTGKNQDKAQSPCFHDLAGDPSSAGSQYAKVKLICSDGEETVASLDLRAVRGTRWIDLLRELAHINHFDLPEDSLRCLVEDTIATDLYSPIIPRAILTCRIPK